jgi:GT2 family glycosyltransferase
LFLSKEGLELVSVIIPTYNGRLRIKNTLDALQAQDFKGEYELIVVDDGSWDQTADLVRSYDQGIKVISQPNQGPGVARNNGARHAQGKIILFTDDDCIPEKNWLREMLQPFSENSDLVGVKGRYRTEQKDIIARFVQLEYEDKYDYMVREKYIDFIDTYSAAFQRRVFLELGGYDTEFPVACAEDVELSYRLSKKGYKMVFASKAVVRHTHPARLKAYLKKKFKFAYWRVIAVKKNPQKIVRDSHTPQVMKMQLIFPPVCLFPVLLVFFFPKFLIISGLGFIGFILTTVPFIYKAMRKDKVVGFLSPFLLFSRTCAQFLGVVGGLLHLINKHIRVLP